MSKQVVQFILFLVVFSMLGLFGYFYYVKPQREYIKINTQDCISKAMASIDREVSKNAPNPYITRAGFSTMQKKQTNDLNNCLENYNTIIFSGPESSILLLNINSLVDGQSDKIGAYIKRIEDKQAAAEAAVASQLASQKQKQDQVNACKSVKPERDKYEACLQGEFKKDNDYAKMSNFMMSPEMNQEGNTCLQKYNYLRFGVNDLNCWMMGISTY